MMVFATHDQARLRKALSVRVSHRFTPGSARFDEDNLVSYAGLVPLLGLAEQTRLPEIIAEKVSITTPRIRSGAANPVPKLLSVIGGMCAGADSIDDLDVLRAGGMPILFNGVYAPSTLGTLLREFTFGHARQLESVLREHLVALTRRADVLTGLDQQAFIDIDSLLRPVYGHAKQGASYGHTKIAGKQVLRKGLSPLATTLSTPTAAPVIAGMRLRAGKTGSGKGAGRMIAQAITTARATGASGKILVRGDSAFGTRTVVRACRRGNAEFSLVLTKNRAVQRAIDSIADTQWTPVRYPGAVHDPDTGGWISEAEVAEVLLHQLHAAHRRSRHRAPPPRHHRNRVRRPHRRTAGAHALRIFRSELRLGALRRNRPQPAPRRRNAGRPALHPRPRRHPPPTDHHRAGSTGPTRTTTRPAPTRPLALGAGLAPTLEQHHRPQPTTCHRLTHPPTPARAPRTVEELDRPAASTRTQTPE
jgi:hypothetical protein